MQLLKGFRQRRVCCILLLVGQISMRFCLEEFRLREPTRIVMYTCNSMQAKRKLNEPCNQINFGRLEALQAAIRVIIIMFGAAVLVVSC